MKMHAKGSNLGNTRRQIPRHSSSFFPILPQQGGFDLSHQYVTNQWISTDWRKHPRISCIRDWIRRKTAASLSSRIHYEQAYDIATTLENGLFIDAASKEEYMNQETLMQRLQTQVNKLLGTKCSQQEVAIPITSTSKMVPSSGLLHAWSSGTVVDPTSQKLAGPIINATDYGAVALNNKYSFPEGGLYHPSIVHEPVSSNNKYGFPEGGLYHPSIVHELVSSNNKYGFPEGGLYHPSIVHELVSSPDDCSTITSCTDMDVFPNFCVSGAGSNLETTSKSISSHFPQQHVDDLEMDLKNYKDCLGTIQRNDSVAFLTAMGKSPQSESLNWPIPHHVPREISDVSNLFPSTSSSRECSSIGDLRQHQSQNLDFQQNFKHFRQLYEFDHKASMSQSSFIVNQGENCSQMVGQQTLEQPQLPTRLPNGYEQITSESPAGRFGLHGSASVNSAIGSKVSVEQILFAYFSYKDLNYVSGDKISFIKFLHSTVCSNQMCTCEQSIKLLLHITNCQSDDCHICRPCKLFCDIGILEPHLEFKSSMVMDSIVRDKEAPSGNSESILPPTKRQKMEPAIGISLINNARSDLWTQKMVHPYSSEVSSKLQQAESPLSCIYSKVTKSNVEQPTNPMLEFASFPRGRGMIGPSIPYGNMSIRETKNSVIDDTLGQTFKRETIPSEGLDANHISKESYPKSHDVITSNNIKENVIKLNSTMHTLCKDPIVAGIEDIQGRSGFNQAGENAEQPTNPILDSMSITEAKNSVIDDTYRQTFKRKTIPSEGLDASHISEESYPKSYDVISSNNIKENVIKLNYTMHTLCKDPIVADIEDIQGRNGFNQAGENAEQPTNPMLDSMSINETKNSVMDDTFGQTFKSETIPSEGLDANHISEESYPKSHDVISSNNIKGNVIKLNSTMHTLCRVPVVADIEDIQGRSGFNQAGENAMKKGIELKADQEKKTKSSKTTVNAVTLTEFFTYDQIREHIMSLRKQCVQSTTEEEGGIAAEACQLCAMQKLFFAPVPIYCLCCGIRIKRNAFYFQRRAQEFDIQHCFCTLCYRNSRGGYITFNGISASKTLLDRKKNDDVFEEAWVECSKCKRWQHQICALYNNKRDLDCNAVYICPRCRLKEIENGMHVPLPKTAIFGAKDLPSTMLSDHIENRLYKCLMQERADKAKGEGNKNLDEVLAAENLSVRVVLSVDKQLKVKKEFLDIFSEKNYPSEFLYRSRVILLFQNIEGVDVCLFGMYVQEFGSECGSPNQRCVYISYLDSVKYFRPERETVTGEALRTFVYHEILIGYLDFCKKRGFTTCYIWACPPLKGEDYVLYCHPDIQKTPKNDKLRRWYHSMLRKASEENIVVGLTNIYDHFFVPNGKWDSKVTAARLPYFDGDYWSGAAMDLARKIEQESGGEYEKQLKTLVTKRTLKAMGHLNPSKDTAKDILVMQKLGQTILPVKEDFIIVQLQHACMHCHEVIVSGKRWFCTECKKFQECERCHTADSHTSINGERHTLCQVLIDGIPFDTRENDIILDNGLFENRNNFLSFCQKNQFQFDTLRRAKHSSMMIIHHLKNQTVGTSCSICCKHIVFQQSWQCEICPEFTICLACYKERGANCHAHKLSQTSSTALFRSGNQELNRKSVMMQQLLEVLQHASQCCSTNTQPCSYPNCLQIKKLLSHASRCTVRVSGGCQHCKKAWMALTIHSRNCRDSECRIPRCMDLKKHAEWIAMQSESRRRAAVVESYGAY